MILTTLSSSSKGNMHILDNGLTSILLDCGINYSRVQLDVNKKNLEGALITHEHGDHIGGCRTIVGNKMINFYGTRETLEKINVPGFSKFEVLPFKTFKCVSYDIMPFEVHHDAAHPVNYLIQDVISGATLLYITDTGYIDDLEFHDIDYFLIECNFDEEWFNKEELTKTEQIKKTRLTSNNGHLSIRQTIEFLKRTINHNTKKIILCHISSSFNNYKEFEDRVKKELKFENVVALDPHHIGPVVNVLHEEKDVIPFE